MADHFLDITGETCPLTFVKTKLALERARPGDRLEIRLKGAEPLENVPRSVTEHGHEVLSLTVESEGGSGGPDDVWRLVIARR
ncbi:MAG: sulfurtransferase TusA family protein [Alphaproteobacteria bacterium]